MGKYCIVSGCDSNTKESYLNGKPKKTMFAFPKDQELLNQWLHQIPKDFTDYQITKKTVICEDHFDKEFLISKSAESHLKKLTTNAYPTIFLPSKIRKSRKKPGSHKTSYKIDSRLQTQDKCRFCLRNFQEDRLEINELVQKLYLNLTQTELRLDQVYSRWICKNCHHNLNFSVSFKSRLIEKQNKLYRAYEALEDKDFDGIARVDIMESDDIKQEHYETPIKSEEDLYEVVEAEPEILEQFDDGYEFPAIIEDLTDQQNNEEFLLPIEEPARPVRGAGGKSKNAKEREKEP
jgi:hypothetical protein